MKNYFVEYFGERRQRRRAFLAILVGNLFCAVAMTFFFQQKQLISGGIGGISLLIHYITGLPTGLFLITLNIPLVLIGYYFLPKKSFTTYGLLSSFVLSFYLMLFDGVKNPFILDDMIIVSLTGGVLNGIGMGIMFRNGTSQGGIDIIAAIYKARTGNSIGKALLGINSIIIIIASERFGIDKGLYTIVAMVVGYQILDRLELRLGKIKQIIIITSRPKEVSNAIMNKIHRGVTVLHGEGAFSGQEQEVLLCALETRQIPRLKSLIREIDQKAFMTIVDAYEVKGKGFEQLEE